MSLAKIHEHTDISSIRSSEDLTAQNRPAVLRGFVDHWPLVEAAKESTGVAAEYILRFDKKCVFEAMIASPVEQGRLFYTPDLQSFNFERMNGYLREAFNILREFANEDTSPAFYIGSKLISDYLPGLEDDNTLSLFDPPVSPHIWMGNSVTVATHSDDSENIACVAVGHRRFTLFPPDQKENLYIGSFEATPGGRPVSMVDLNTPDLNQFPNFETALTYAEYAELSPGDAIFIPNGWWHNVESLDKFNVLVNYWWN